MACEHDASQSIAQAPTAVIRHGTSMLQDIMTSEVLAQILQTALSSITQAAAPGVADITAKQIPPKLKQRLMLA